MTDWNADFAGDVETECARCGSAFLVAAEVFTGPSGRVEPLQIECGDCTDERLQAILDALEHPGQRRVAADPDNPWSEMVWR